jgi:transcription elongation factor GreA
VTHERAGCSQISGGAVTLRRTMARFPTVTSPDSRRQTPSRAAITSTPSARAPRDLFFLDCVSSCVSGDDQHFDNRRGVSRRARGARRRAAAARRRVGIVSQCAEGANEWILAARNGLHAGWLCYSRFQMKDRILKRFNDEIAALERELKLTCRRRSSGARDTGRPARERRVQGGEGTPGIVNARIAMLKKRVGEISLLNLDRIPHDRAGFGSTVHLAARHWRDRCLPAGHAEESDFEKGMISTSSPIGRAILNKRKAMKSR